jgi:hypothetical protein
MSENELKVVVNGAYNNIKFDDMSDKDTIILEKKFDAVIRKQIADKWNEGKTRTMVQAAAVYNGEDVGFFINGMYLPDGNYMDTDQVADLFDETGPQDTKVKVTCSVSIGKDKKGKEKVFRSYTFEKVE